MFFGSLVQDLAQLREAAVLELQALQAEQHRLEEEIRTAQERHQTVSPSPVGPLDQSLLDLLLQSHQMWWPEETCPASKQSNS